MIVTGAWADILNPAIRKIFDDVYGKFAEEYSTVFSAEKSDRNYEKYSSSTGFGMAKDVGEAEEIPQDDPVQGFDLTLTHKKIGDAFVVSRELVEDDMFNVISAKPKQLAIALRRKVEYDAADIFNNADSTTNNTGPDGKALSSASHPREDGGTAQSNRATAALNETNLNTALVAISKLLDGKGQKIMIEPDLLIIPPDLEATARILMESTGRTGTANNDVNVFKGRLDLFVYHWLTDINNWFLLDRKQSLLKFVWRRKVDLTRDDNVTNDVARWYATGRYSMGWVDWRAIYCNIVA